MAPAVALRACRRPNQIKSNGDLIELESPTGCVCGRQPAAPFEYLHKARAGVKYEPDFSPPPAPRVCARASPNQHFRAPLERHLGRAGNF